MKIFRAAALFAVLAGGAAWAAGPNFSYDSSKPIAVNADNVQADLNGQTSTFTGNVVIMQGDVRLHADTVKVSQSGNKASNMEARGHVVVNTPSGDAVGDVGIYDVSAQQLRLTGNVVLTKDQNVMKGNALDVNMATGVAHLTATASAATGQNGRVQGLFVPAQKGPAAPKTAAPKQNP